MQLLSRAILLLNSIVIGLIGVTYLYDPNVLLANYGLTAGSIEMDNMLRGTYGGLFIGMAGLFALGAFYEVRRSDALGLLGIFMGGLALGRLASIMLVGTPSGSINTLLAYEAAVCTIALYLYRRNVVA